MSDTRKKTDRLGNASAIAGIISAVIALISLVAGIVQPDQEVVAYVEDKFPYGTFFFFMFAFISITYYLISRLADRIGDIEITVQGDVINSSHIGDYIEKNSEGIGEEQMEKILAAVLEASKPEQLTQAIDKLGDANKRQLLTTLAEKDPEVIEAITKAAKHV